MNNLQVGSALGLPSIIAVENHPTVASGTTPGGAIKPNKVTVAKASPTANVALKDSTAQSL